MFDKLAPRVEGGPYCAQEGSAHGAAENRSLAVIQRMDVHALLSTCRDKPFIPQGGPQRAILQALARQIPQRSNGWNGGTLKGHRYLSAALS